MVATLVTHFPSFRLPRLKLCLVARDKEADDLVPSRRAILTDAVLSGAQISTDNAQSEGNEEGGKYHAGEIACELATSIRTRYHVMLNAE